MATTKTLTPTNQAITISAFTEKPDNRINATNDDKLADAVNALNQKSLTRAASLSDLNTIINGMDSAGRITVLLEGSVADALINHNAAATALLTKMDSYTADMIVFSLGGNYVGTIRYNTSSGVTKEVELEQKSKIQRITLSVEFTNGSGTIAATSIDGTPFAAYDSSGYIYNISKNGSNWIVTGFYFDSTGKAVFVSNGSRGIVISYHKN